MLTLQTKLTTPITHQAMAPVASPQVETPPQRPAPQVKLGSQESTVPAAVLKAASGIVDVPAIQDDPRAAHQILHVLTHLVEGDHQHPVKAHDLQTSLETHDAELSFLKKPLETHAEMALALATQAMRTKSTDLAQLSDVQKALRADVLQATLTAISKAHEKQQDKNLENAAMVIAKIMESDKVHTKG